MIYSLRMTACILWLISGIMVNSPAGDVSAFASCIFILALIMEKRTNQSKLT